jgi:hypothetical protein
MMNWKGFRRKSPWPNFKALLWHSPGGTEENHEKLSQDSWSLGQNLNLKPSEYETGILTTRPQHSVLFIHGLLLYVFMQHGKTDHTRVV